MKIALKGEKDKVEDFPDISAMMSICYPNSNSFSPSFLPSYVPKFDSFLMMDDKTNEPRAFLHFKRNKYIGKTSGKTFDAFEIYNVCMNPKFQGQGLSANFIQQSFKLLKEKYNLDGNTILALQTSADYSKYLEAVRLYLKLGFSYHVEVNVSLKDVDPDVLFDEDPLKRTSFDKFLTVYKDQISKADKGTDFNMSMYRLLDDKVNLNIRKIQRHLLRASGRDLEASEEMVDALVNPVTGESPNETSTSSSPLPGNSTSSSTKLPVTPKDSYGIHLTAGVSWIFSIFAFTFIALQ